MSRRNQRLPRYLLVALAAGLLLVPLVCWWVVRAEIVFRSADLAANSLPVAAVFVLILLLGARKILGFVHCHLLPQDILLIYVMLASTVGVASLGFAQSLVIQLPAPFWRATPENRWQEFADLLPTWAAPRDTHVLRGFYLSGNFWRPEILGAWAMPLCLWTLMLLALTLAMLSIAWLLRPRFIAHERMVFPLAVVALEFTGLGPAKAAGSRLFWLGAAAAVFVQALNAANYQWPIVPALRVLPRDVSYLFAAMPKSAGINLWVALYPCATGLGYLLPLDTGLSCWLWHLLVKVEYLVSAWLGVAGAGWPLQGEQAQGAMLALALLALGLPGTIRISLSNRFSGGWAGWLLAASWAALVSFAAALGMRMPTAAAFFALYFLGIVAVTRLRAQVGPMWNPGTDVAWLLMAPAGQGRLPRGDLVGLAALRWFSYGDCRGAPMPTQLEAFKMAEVARMPEEMVAVALALALLVAVPASLLATVSTYYAYGADTAAVHLWRTGRGDLPWAKLAGWLAAPQPRDLSALAAVVLGAGVLAGHTLALSRLSWWPLSPAGFAMAITGSLEWLWFPIFLAWLAKAAILRWGGMKTYRRSLGFFLGLVAGDYFMAGLLGFLSFWRPGGLYRPFPI